MVALDLGTVGASNSKVSGNTLSVVASQDIPAGSVLVLGWAQDNPASTSAPTLSLSAVNGTDSWIPVVNQSSANPVGESISASAGIGIWSAVFILKTTAAIDNGDTITTMTLTLGGSASPITAKAMIVRGVSGVDAIVRGDTAQTGVSTSGGVSAGKSGILAGDFVVGFIMDERNGISTPDSDTTGGVAWGTIDTSIANTGSAATSMAVGIQTKIPTTDAKQTYNPAGGGNDAVGWCFALIPSVDVPNNANFLQFM